MALTYEDMNCSLAGNYDYTASAMVRGVCDYIGINLSDIDSESIVAEKNIHSSKTIQIPLIQALE
jgi:hypothetical protein